MGNEIQKVKDAVEVQIRQTNEIIASNEAIADAICEMDNTLASGFNVLSSGLQELYYSIDYGLQEICDKLDLQNKTLEAIREILERPLDTQAKELRKRAEEAYLNGWIDEAESDLLIAEQKNYQDFIVHHILGNIYFYHKNNYQKALEYYQKAAKYASPQSKKYASNALLCVATVYYKLGQLPEAYKSTKMAIGLPLPKGRLEIAVLDFLRKGEKIQAIKVYRQETGTGLKEANDAVEAIEKTYNINVRYELPEDSRVLYHHARYSVKMGYTDEFIGCLTKSILKDANYLITADRDEMLSDVKDEIKKLAENLRREKANAVNNVKHKIDVVRKEAEALGITDFEALDNKLAEVNELCIRNSYFDLLKAEQIARGAYKENLSNWIEVKNVCLRELRKKQNGVKKSGIYVFWGFLLAIVADILIVIIGSIPGWSGLLNWSGLLIIIIWIASAWILKQNRLDVIENKIQIENSAIARLQFLQESSDFKNDKKGYLMVTLKFFVNFCNLIGGLLMALDYMVGVDRLRRIEQLLSNELSRIQKFRPPKLRLLAKFFVTCVAWSDRPLSETEYRTFSQRFQSTPIIARTLFIILFIIIFGLFVFSIIWRQHVLYAIFLYLCLILFLPLIVWSIIKLSLIITKALARLLLSGPKGILGTIGFILLLVSNIVNLFLL